MGCFTDKKKDKTTLSSSDHIIVVCMHIILHNQLGQKSAALQESTTEKGIKVNQV